ILAGGRIRTDEKEEHHRQTGEKGCTVFGPEWEQTEDQRKVCEALEEVTKQVSTKNIQAVTIAYVMQKMLYVLPVIGGRKVEHLHASIEALDVALDEEQVKYIESILSFDFGFPMTVIVSRNRRITRNTAHLVRWLHTQAIHP
ncbi:hypothetical protein C8Q80DRAFT_1288691, partial [Daedaleopsis nitida]